MSECISPITVRRKLDGKIMIAPCGRCPACRTRIQNDWAFRCQQEAKDSRCYFFIHLTYNDENLTYGDSAPTLVPKDLQLFHKQMRNKLGYDTYRYFSCGEYGDFFDRPHYHILAFFSELYTQEDIENVVAEIWTKGIFSVEKCDIIQSSKYCAKYTIKSLDNTFKKLGVCPPFARMSRRPGLGANYVNDLNRKRAHLTMNAKCVDSDGTPYSMPKYYKEKIFTETERAIISDKQQSDRMSRFSFMLSTNEMNDKHCYLDSSLNSTDSFCRRYSRKQFGHLPHGEDIKIIYPDYSKVKIDSKYSFGSSEDLINAFENERNTNY